MYPDLRYSKVKQNVLNLVKNAVDDEWNRKTFIPAV